MLRWQGRHASGHASELLAVWAQEVLDGCRWGGDSGGGGETLHLTDASPVPDAKASLTLSSSTLPLGQKPKWVEYDRQARTALCHPEAWR